MSFVLGHSEITWNQFDPCKTCSCSLLGVIRTAYFPPLLNTLLNTQLDALCTSEVFLNMTGGNMNCSCPCVSSGDFFFFFPFHLLGQFFPSLGQGPHTDQFSDEDLRGISGILLCSSLLSYPQNAYCSHHIVLECPTCFLNSEYLLGPT